MDILSNLAFGFGVAVTLKNLLYCFIGVFLGTLIGVLPGIGPVATVAMLLPLTFNLDPATAMIMLAGIYYGAQYGGSTTAILVNIPGESSSVITTLDGYQMARQGRAGPALGIAAIGSFIAGSVATLVVALFSPPLAEIALKFQPADYFSLMVFGLVGAVVLARGSLRKAIAMVVLGLLLGLIGTDVNSGVMRFTFGIPALAEGISFVALAMGMFGIAEVIYNLEQRDTSREVFTSALGSVLPSRADLKLCFWPIARGTALGSILGILPGGGALLSSFAAYTIEKKIAKPPRRFGDGDIRGVAVPESANNAGAQTSFIPMLTLGVPSNPTMALMIGALMIQGIQPGPQVMVQRPELFWGIVASMWIGNLFLLALNLPMIGLWVRLLSGALPAPVPGHPGVLLHRRVHHQQQRLRPVPAGDLRGHRLPAAQARLRARAAYPGTRPGAHDGGVPAARLADLARRSDGAGDEPAQPGLPAGGGRAAGLDRGAADPHPTRGGAEGVGGSSRSTA